VAGKIVMGKRTFAANWETDEYLALTEGQGMVYGNADLSHNHTGKQQGEQYTRCPQKWWSMLTTVTEI